MELKLVYGIQYSPSSCVYYLPTTPPYKNCGPTGHLQARIYVPTYLHRACMYLRSRVGYPGRYHDNLILMKVNKIGEDRIFDLFVFIQLYRERRAGRGQRRENSRAALAFLRIRIGWLAHLPINPQPRRNGWMDECTVRSTSHRRHHHRHRRLLYSFLFKSLPFPSSPTADRPPLSEAHIRIRTSSRLVSFPSRCDYDEAFLAAMALLASVRLWGSLCFPF